MMPYLQDGTCSQEHQTLGAFGPIENDELLVRIIKAPQHLAKKTGEVKPSLFTWADIRKNGVSLVRNAKITPQDLLTYARAIAGMRAGESLHGFCSAKARHLREIVVETDVRALCVLEDPVAGIPNLPDNPAHAVAISSVEIPDDQEDKVIEIQTKLWKIFGKHLVE